MNQKKVRSLSILRCQVCDISSQPNSSNRREGQIFRRQETGAGDRSGGVVECWSGGVVECWSGGVVEWWSDGVVEWWSGGVMEWWSGGVVMAPDTDLLAPD